MTGFAEVESRHQGAVVRVQLSSVNAKRGLDMQVNLPRNWAAWENEVREAVQLEVSRARLQIQVNFENGLGNTAGWQRIDPAAVKHYLNELAKLKKAGLKPPETGGTDISWLLRMPGVWVEEEVAMTASEPLRLVLMKTLSRALQAYNQCREREGKALQKDVSGRIKTLQRLLVSVKRAAPRVKEAHQTQLLKRLEGLGVEALATEERIMKEVALFADRSDITEETTRLAAHLEEGLRLCAQSQPSGRSLEFLIQEMGREVNTIGNKANALDISRTVLDMKSELEKIREQIQNVE